ncbi:MAG: 3'-5' exonuclease [Vicinamibacterales bacterium]
MNTNSEVYISVDVESAGPIPGEYSLLTIGACSVDGPQRTFACELKPLNRNADPKALEVSGLSLEDLGRRGLEPAVAMQRFADWLADGLAEDQRLVFVGLNAPFDWSFVNYYFHRFVGSNPFGFTALDIKAFYMGSIGCSWADTRSSQMVKVLRPQGTGDHNALHDAQYQAELFRLIRDRTRR